MKMKKKDFEDKIRMVLQSCETKKQLDVAFKMIDLYYKKYGNKIKKTIDKIFGTSISKDLYKEFEKKAKEVQMDLDSKRRREDLEHEKDFELSQQNLKDVYNTLYKGDVTKKA
jgi:hypothetical protein